MFVECEVEVVIKDRTLSSFADHDLKLWLQRAFKANSCYRISNFKAGADRTVRALVALNARVLPEAQWSQVEVEPADTALLRKFIEQLFEAKGTLRCLSEPKLKPY